jgi:ketosteroid isomerase-like protein
MAGEEHEADSEAIIRRAYRAFAERDVETLAELASEEIEVSTVTGILAGRDKPYHGRAGIEDYMRDLGSTWKRIELQPQAFHALGEGQMLVFGRVRAWHERGLLDSANAWLWTLRDGEVVSVLVFADPAEARSLIRG